MQGGPHGQCDMRRGQRHTTSAKEKIRAARLEHAAGHAVGFCLKPNGYVEYTRGPHKGRMVHDVIVEARIGRRLRDGELVHHRDGNRQNNIDENLELTTRSEHARHHRLLDIQHRKRDAHGRFS